MKKKKEIESIYQSSSWKSSQFHGSKDTECLLLKTYLSSSVSSVNCRQKMRSHYSRLFCIPWRATLNDEIFIDAGRNNIHTHNINEKERDRERKRNREWEDEEGRGEGERERERGTRVAVRRRSRIKVLLRCFFVTAFALLLRSPGTMTNPRHHCAGPCSSRKM